MAPARVARAAPGAALRASERRFYSGPVVRPVHNSPPRVRREGCLLDEKDNRSSTCGNLDWGLRFSAPKGFPRYPPARL